MGKIKINKELELCEPELFGKLISFKTRFFMLYGEKAEIIATQSEPYLITFKWKVKSYTRSNESLIKTFNLIQ